MSYSTHVGHRAHGDDVHSRIFHSHLAYLNQEETPSKLKQRHALENLILDFLSVVSHDEKFSFTEVKMIFERSIRENPNFSACKAALAFEALERYAINLLNHPWRKEYKVVKLFSGFYKHSVENQLYGANAIFLLLGYQQSDMGMLYLDEPVDPDRVARVALDCLKAYAECQIFVQICEKIKGYKCTWLEILNVRQEYICGVDEAVRILHQLKKASIDQGKQEKWLNGREHMISKDNFICDKSQNHLQTDMLVDVSSAWPSSTLPSVPLSRDLLVPQSSLYSSSTNPAKSKTVLHSHTKLPSWSESSYYTENNKKKFGRSDGTSEVLSRSFEEHLQSVFDDSKNIFTNSSYVPGMQTVTSPVFKSSSQRNYDGFDNFDLQSRDAYNLVPNPKTMFGSPHMHFFPPGHVLPIPNYPCPVPHDVRCPHPGPFQFPMCCDQHILPPPKTAHAKDGQHSSFTDKSSVRLDQTLPNIIPDSRSSFCPISVDKHNPVPFPIITQPNVSNFNATSHQVGSSQPQNKRDSFYDNVPSTFDFETPQIINLPSENLTVKKLSQVNGTTNFNSSTVPTKLKPVKLPSESITGSAFQKPVQQQSHYNPIISNPRATEPSQITDSTVDHKVVKSSQKKWACSSCTFYNSGERNICDMCGRSKVPGPESTPLVSGGRECPQCTLVNKKDSENCTACGASLKDSPTYI